MVDFEYWFSNVVAECELISSDSDLRRTWLNGARLTAAYDYDELMEQIFGDLNLDDCVQHFAARLRDIGALEVVERFVAVLHDIDAAVESKPVLRDPNTLLGSAEWRNLKDAARRVVELSAAAPYRERT